MNLNNLKYLFSKYSILLIFIFNSISLSTIVVAIKFIISLRVTFWIKVPHPIFD